MSTTHRCLHLPALCVLILLAGGSLAMAQPRVNYPRINTAYGYAFDDQWPLQPSVYEWGAMAGIAVDNKGLIWTLNRGEIPVQVYDASGKLVRQWGQGSFVNPHQLSIGPHGDIWIPDSKGHAVYKFSPGGELLLTIGVPGEFGEDDKHFKKPTDVAETPEGDIFIADGYRNNRVVHCDAQGRFVKAFGKLGVEPGEFSLPHSIALDSKGRLYVADRNNARVQVFDQSGTFLTQWTNLCVPWTVRITADDEVYVCGSAPAQWQKETRQLGLPPTDQLVMKLNTQGRIQHWWRFPLGEIEDSQPGELCWVHGLAVDAHGNLYLGDIKGKRAQKFLLTK